MLKLIDFLTFFFNKCSLNPRNLQLIIFRKNHKKCSLNPRNLQLIDFWIIFYLEHLQKKQMVEVFFDFRWKNLRVFGQDLSAKKNLFSGRVGFLKVQWDFFPKSDSTFEIWFPQSLSVDTRSINRKSKIHFLVEPTSSFFQNPKKKHDNLQKFVKILYRVGYKKIDKFCKNFVPPPPIQKPYKICTTTPVQIIGDRCIIIILSGILLCVLAFGRFLSKWNFLDFLVMRAKKRTNPALEL